MNDFLRSPLIKVLCWYLMLFIAGLIPVPESAWASFIYHQPEQTNELDPESRKILQTIFENELITVKLSELGLSLEEVIYRIEQLSPEEKDVVVRELSHIQTGGQAELVIVELIIPLLLIIFMLPFIILASVLPIEKTKKAREESVSFEPTSDASFPSNEENVTVLKMETPGEGSINVGKVCINDFVVGGKKEKRSKILLRQMKDQAARHGADAIELITDEPQRVDSYLSWCGKAYRTYEIRFDKRKPDVYLPSHPGEARIFKEKEPVERFVHVGKVCINDYFTGAEKEKRSKILLSHIKKEAAKYGADGMELITDEPECVDNYNSWCAQAYITHRLIFESESSVGYLTPYTGVVKVIREREPMDSLIHVGKVCISDHVPWVVYGRREKILLSQMKNEAAKHGADAIELITQEPESSGSYLFWCAEAYSTQDIEDTQ